MSVFARQLKFIRWALIACVLSWCGFSQDATPALQNNPFARPKSQGTAVAAPVSANPLDNYEFTGLMIMGGKLQVSVFDKANNRSHWLLESVPLEDDGLTLISYQEDDMGTIERITLQRGTAKKEVLLNSSSIVAMPDAPAQPAQSKAPAPSRAPTETTGQTVSSDEEVRARMKRVAEEIRRRRAMRSEILKERQQQQQPAN